MKRFNAILQLTAIFIAVAVISSSCKKVEDPEAFIPDRMFTPTAIKATGGETQAVINWNKSLFSDGLAVTYTLEVSANPDFTGTPAYTVTTDTTEVVVTDANLAILTPYYARVKANASGNIEASKGWVATTTTFRITGEQLFTNIADVDIKTTSVLLKWRSAPGLTKITLTSTGGTPVDYTLDAADLDASEKLITGLTPTTAYTAQLFRGTVLKGNVNFTTKTPSIYAVVLTPGDNLLTAVANAANGDIIGLDPGSYDCKDASDAFANLVITQKKIAIQSTSGNPANTIVNFKELTLKGTGAGITVKGITFDATAGLGDYFINLTGMGTDGEAANFEDINVDNCTVKSFRNCFMRANRASANGGHKIANIKINNSKILDCLSTAAYTLFTLERLEFKTLEITNSTMAALGRAIIGASTNFSMAAPPMITIDHCTINNFGRDGRNNFFLDANTNPVTITIQNSIIANTPMTGQTTGTSLVRASAAANSVFTNNNTFKLTDGAATPASLTFPALFSQQNNQTIDLGWTTATTDFSIPAGSPLRTASSSGGAIGDPRWVN